MAELGPLRGVRTRQAELTGSHLGTEPPGGAHPALVECLPPPLLLPTAFRTQTRSLPVQPPPAPSWRKAFLCTQGSWGSSWLCLSTQHGIAMSPCLSLTTQGSLRGQGWICYFSSAFSAPAQNGCLASARSVLKTHGWPMAEANTHIPAKSTQGRRQLSPLLPHSNQMLA